MDTTIDDFPSSAGGALPPLPLPIPLPQPHPLPTIPLPIPQPFPIPHPLPLRSLRCGCYLLNFKPSGSPFVTYDGTLRVECQNNGRTASGDLYQRRVLFLPLTPGFPLKPILLAGPNPSAGIPILSRAQYRYYISVTQILEGFTAGTGFTLGYDLYRFNKNSGGWNTGGTWTNEGSFTSALSWIPAPSGYPSSGDYLEGDLRNSAGALVGRLTLGWLSPYLRKATVEIDRVQVSEPAIDNGAGVDWQAIGNEIGWDITVNVSETNIPEPSGPSWSDAEAHAVMLAHRDSVNLDAEWHYHVLCVRLLDSTPRGVMYDNGATDSDNVPREGCVIASDWMIPNTNDWGLVKGQRFGTAKLPYFRTAVHETGHAMGLYHNTIDLGFMNTTDVIAASGTATTPFPNNIQWAFAPDDQKRLRHMPDIYVRPGGTPFGTSYSTTPISPTDHSFEVDGLRLEVTPLLETVPLGAPVRINLKLTNNSQTTFVVPADLSLAGGFISGQVVDSARAVRTFWPLVLCMDGESLKEIAPGESIVDSLTLLRGRQGALFPNPGLHKIHVEVKWDAGGANALVVGDTTVLITAARDEAHATAALKVLSTPDALLTLVLGGDHLPEGVSAIETAVNNEVLRPHFAFIEARRRAQDFWDRKGNLDDAGTLIDDSTVMSPAEIKKAATLISTEGADSAARQNIAQTLKTKVTSQDVSDEIRQMVNSL